VNVVAEERERERERERAYLSYQYNNNTRTNSNNGRLPERNNHHSWPPMLIIKNNQTVNDGVAHSKNPKKCAYHMTFELDLDLEHTLDAR